MRNTRTGLKPEDGMEDAGQPALIAVLTPDGTIQYVNEAWVRHARRNGVRADYRFPGEDYLAVCSRAAEAGDRHASEMLDGLRCVLNGQTTSFRMAYPCAVPGQTTAYYEAQVSTTPAGMGRIFVTHVRLRQRPGSGRLQTFGLLAPVENELAAPVPTWADGRYAGRHGSGIPQEAF
ncbi:MAG: hypothetical protein ACFCVE_15155 [Phycisphaerae bacterium]